VVGLESVLAKLRRDRLAGRRIVFTNGCFDLLHAGHVGCLQQARGLGDVLVVGVNSDRSVRRLKGPDRPLNSEEDRVRVLAGLRWVDHVVAFDDDRPDALIAAIRPDVYVKGGDYAADALPERALVESYGGRVVALSYLPGRSTSEIVARIRGDRPLPRV
jgi:D-beta-D-heptose 7-phosphate kinase / D-beta-D-heptose 1-phosphate adenosyltransferase